MVISSFPGTPGSDVEVFNKSSPQAWYTILVYNKPELKKFYGDDGSLHCKTSQEAIALLLEIREAGYEDGRIGCGGNSTMDTPVDVLHPSLLDLCSHR